MKRGRAPCEASRRDGCGEVHGARARGRRPPLAHPRRRRREPQPRGRERRAARHRQAFDAWQTSLNLVAVGYSLGLAASVLYLGALGDRYGRKMMLLLGTALAIPASLLAAFAPSDRGAVRRAADRRPRRGHGVPDHARAHHRALGGPARTQARSRSGRRSAARSPRSARCCPAPCSRSFDWGSVFLITLPLAVVALYLAWRLVPAHVNEAHRPASTTSAASSRCSASPRWSSRSTSRRCPTKGTLAIGLGVLALVVGRRLRAPPAPGAEPALRPRRRGPAHLLGRGVRRDHRLRHADGRDVHRPAVPPERARLLDARRGARHPARRGVHGARRAALGQARRGARRARRRC